MKKAFTLIELLIVICILSLLVFVLFKAYNTVSEVSFRVEQQRKVNEEVLLLSEIVQNFANRNSIDFEKYDTSLNDAKWFTGILYLSWEDGRFSIYSSWDCVDFGQLPAYDNLQNWCSFYLQKDDWSLPVQITDDSVYFSSVKFKIIPYFDDYFNSDESLCETNYFACVNDDWFSLFVDVYPKYYNGAVWSNNVRVVVQHFFNI